MKSPNQSLEGTLSTSARGDEVVDDIELGRLRAFARDIDAALARTASAIAREKGSAKTLDFDFRGELYSLAHQLAPNARKEELETMRSWVSPRRNESAMDLAAGSGFLTKEICGWVAGAVYAVDPSETQISALRRNAPRAYALCSFLDTPGALGQIAPGTVDFATSLAGIHHVEDQRAMFANVAKVLKPGGRFVVADICAGSSVARHFDGVVAARSLTGHNATWLHPERIRRLVQDISMEVRRLEIVPLHMRFTSEAELALFYQALHAWPLSKAEAIAHIADVLGIERQRETLAVKWPLLFAQLDRV